MPVVYSALSVNDTTAPKPISIADALARVHARIAAACQVANRDPAEVTLLAVSKTKPESAIHAALAAGQTAFGESYLQDAMPKLMAAYPRQPEWHFIGPIQSNKTRDIANHFAWVHSVDRIKVARRLSDQRDDSLPPLNCCLQVNISGEAAKAGVSPAELGELVAAVREMPRLTLRGLMCIPARATDPAAQALPFRALAELAVALRSEGHALDTLSMGMSADLEAAIAEGATIVRVGTDIFGARS